MDPVLLPPLLDTIDLLGTKLRPLSIKDLGVKRKITQKRFGEIGRVLESFGIASRHSFELVPETNLEEFIEVWEKADLRALNQIFCRYEPYQDFMTLLSSEHFLSLPPSSDKLSRQNALEELRIKKIQLTFVALDTFKWWGLGTAYVYVSHIGDRKIYWGGQGVQLSGFESNLIQHYERMKPKDGYVNVGQLADQVCRDLLISFVTFEKMFAELCLQFPEKYLTSTSLTRLPTTKSPVQTILPRHYAKELAKNRDREGNIEWTEKRHMEDGVFIGTRKRNVKLVSIRKEI